MPRRSPLLLNPTLWIALWLATLPGAVPGLDRSALAQPSASGDAVVIGIEGHYRVGRWTGVRFPGNRPIDSIETRDGDGVQVEYEQPKPISGRAWGYVLPGSEAAPLVLRDRQGVVVSARLPTLGSPSRGPAMIPRSMSWIVALGDPLGIDRIGANALLNRDPQIAVSMPNSASGFPDSVLGYDGVDMMLMGGSSIELIQTLGPDQRQAISDWVTDGGRLFLTLGQSAPDFLRAAPWIGDLLPTGPLTTVNIAPSALETFTSSQTPLQPFAGAELPKDRGRVLIMGRTTRRISTPIAVEYNVGFGRVTVVAADLEHEMFAAWPERLDLITQLTGSILIPAQDQAQRKNRATAYDDLAGQLRATLDQFKSKRRFAFSLVSLVLMALIAAIGPLDYLLINRFFGRPLLGWISFPVVAIGLSVLLVAQSRPVASPGESASSSTLHCNRIEIFDIDSIRQIGRGFSVSYLYAHDAARFDVAVQASPSLQSVSGGMEQILTAPFGYPGESFGGIQIAIEDARLPVYQAPLGGQRPRQGMLKNLPLASRSSKGIATRLQFDPKLTDEISIDHRPGSQLLQGELTNPLPFDLLDGMLVYRNWTYVLPTRFRAGDRVARVETLRQKNFRWQLSRQKALESATETQAWNPAQNDSPLRIAEMLMFHRAVGGSRYTSLQDVPLSFLDLSHVLTADRCMLIGRIAEPMTELQTQTSAAASEPASSTLTLIRVVLPVNNSRR